MEDTDVPVTIVGVVIIILLLVFALKFIFYYPPTPPVLSSTKADTPYVLLGYRIFDVVFLAFLVFAAVTGLAAIFRPEKIGEGE